MPRVYKLSINGLKRFIAEQKSEILKEFGHMGDACDTKPKETDADEYADSLEKHIDYLQKQGIHETKLLKQLKGLRESMRLRKMKIEELRARKTGTGAASDGSRPRVKK